MLQEFFTFDVSLGRWIASQIVGLISLIIVFIAFQSKTKKKTLFFMCIGSACGVIGFALLGNYVMAGIFISVLARNLVFLWLEIRYIKTGKELKKSLSLPLLVIFIAMTVVGMWIPFDGWWFDWLLLAASILSLIGKWMKGPHWIKLSVVPWAMFGMYNSFVFRNLMGILIELVVLTSIAMFYVKWLRSKKASVEEVVEENTEEPIETVGEDA